MESLKSFKSFKETKNRKKDARCWSLDTGTWILDAGHWILDPGYSMLDTPPWMLETRTKKSAEGIFSRRGAVNAERDIRNGGRMKKQEVGDQSLRAAEGRQETERRQADAEQQIGRTKTESLSSHDMRGPDLIRRRFLALMF